MAAIGAQAGDPGEGRGHGPRRRDGQPPARPGGRGRATHGRDKLQVEERQEPQDPDVGGQRPAPLSIPQPETYSEGVSDGCVRGAGPGPQTRER